MASSGLEQLPPTSGTAACLAKTRVRYPAVVWNKTNQGSRLRSSTGDKGSDRFRVPISDTLVVDVDDGRPVLDRPNLQ